MNEYVSAATTPANDCKSACGGTEFLNYETNTCAADCTETGKKFKTAADATNGNSQKTCVADCT